MPVPGNIWPQPSPLVVVALTALPFESIMLICVVDPELSFSLFGLRGISRSKMSEYLLI